MTTTTPTVRADDISAANTPNNSKRFDVYVSYTHGGRRLHNIRGIILGQGRSGIFINVLQNALRREHQIAQRNNTNLRPRDIQKLFTKVKSSVDTNFKPDGSRRRVLPLERTHGTTIPRPRVPRVPRVLNRREVEKPYAVEFWDLFDRLHDMDD